MKQSHEKMPKHQFESSGSDKKAADQYGSDDRSSGKRSSEKGSRSAKMSEHLWDEADSE